MSDLKDTKLIGTSNVPSITIRNEDLGTPGARITLHIIPHIEGEEASDEQKMSDTTLRQFRISARLSSSLSASGRLDANFSPKDGDSYLLIPANSDHFRVDTNMGSFQIKKNEAGRFSYIEMNCSARSYIEARSTFIETVYPALDHFSYVMNVPLFVTMIRTVDLVHQITHFDCAAPYHLQILPNSASQLFLEMKPVYAMYREAKNTESDFYKFLCFYKIMEGLMGKMRATAVSRAKTSGIELKIERNFVPDDRQIASDFKQYVGKPMKRFFDNVLTDKFRNTMAHFMTDDGAVLRTSGPAELYVYSTLALITDLCARQLIGTHERLLAQLPHTT